MLIHAHPFRRASHKVRGLFCGEVTEHSQHDDFGLFGTEIHLDDLDGFLAADLVGHIIGNGFRRGHVGEGFMVGRFGVFLYGCAPEFGQLTPCNRKYPRPKLRCFALKRGESANNADPCF